MKSVMQLGKPKAEKVFFYPSYFVNMKMIPPNLRLYQLQ